jgi:hypothetical protein
MHVYVVPSLISIYRTSSLLDTLSTISAASVFSSMVGGWLCQLCYGFHLILVGQIPTPCCGGRMFIVSSAVATGAGPTLFFVSAAAADE